MDNNIENFLEYDVSDPIWLKIINGQIPLIEIIDKITLISYLESENKKFCANNCLCEICRNPLDEYIDYEEVWGNKRISNIYYSCPNGC
jgi:AAA15 family ATPase/GTPase